MVHFVIQLDLVLSFFHLYDNSNSRRFVNYISIYLIYFFSTYPRYGGLSNTTDISVRINVSIYFFLPYFLWGILFYFFGFLVVTLLSFSAQFCRPNEFFPFDDFVVSLLRLLQIFILVLLHHVSFRFLIQRGWVVSPGIHYIICLYYYYYRQ